eukprot:g5241.t1
MSFQPASEMSPGGDGVVDGDGLEGLLFVLVALVGAVIIVMGATGRLREQSDPIKGHAIPLAEAKPLATTCAPKRKQRFKPIADRYHTLSQVQRALREAGLESSNLIVGIDFTKSNTWQGEESFGGKCLHHLDEMTLNPYEQVIHAIGRTLEDFDDDQLIPAFGFGDATTGGNGVFALNKKGPCQGFRDVLRSYRDSASDVRLSGPTNFAPLINAAAHIAKTERSFHILVIVADGQVTSKQATVEAIVRASNDAPLSIIMVGVGDGPWKSMQEFDDALPQRRWDNFQFVDFNRAHRGASEEERDSCFAMTALMEVPEQFQMIAALGLIE